MEKKEKITAQPTNALTLLRTCVHSVVVVHSHFMKIQ